MKFKLYAVYGLLLLATLLTAQQQQVQPPAAAFKAKLSYMRENAARQMPDPRPTELLQNEINAYLASPEAKLPAGLEALTTVLHPKQIVGAGRVDFDKLRAGHEDSNPFLNIFTGIHDVIVEASAEGAEGQAQVSVQTASIDGVTLPRFALELFINKYLKPKYPNAGMETRFALPERIVTATVGEGKIVLMQK